MILWMKNRLSIPIFILSIGVSTLAFSIYHAQEAQRKETTRQASFEMLKTLNHFQYLVDSESYGLDDNGRYLEAWSDVLLINDLSIFISPRLEDDCQELLTLWTHSFEHLEKKHINEKLSRLILKTREDLKDSIHRL